MLTTDIANAVRQARYEIVDDMCCATVPGLRGVIATATTKEECRAQLAEVIEAWVSVSMAHGAGPLKAGGAT